MKKIDEFYKTELDKIDYLSVEEEEIIHNNIKDKYRKNQKLKKTVLGISTFLLVCLVGIGITYAEEISDLIKTFKLTTTTHDNGNTSTYAESYVRKEINYDADLPEVDSANDGGEYSIQELEEILDIKILKSDYFKNDILKQVHTRKKQGKIMGASFLLENFTDIKKLKDKTVDKYNMNISFSTKYSEDVAHSGWETGQGFKVEEYYLKNLGTVSYILSRDYDYDNLVETYYAFIIYDDMFYDFDFKCTFKTVEEEKELIKNILDSLHY